MPSVNSPEPPASILPYLEVEVVPKRQSNGQEAFTCDACKMFYRRVIIEHLSYTCYSNNQCFEDFTAGKPLPKCKSCRYQRCVSLGMDFEQREVKRRKKQKPRPILEVKNEADALVADVMSRLLCLDDGRATVMKTCFTDMDPTLGEMIQRRELNVFHKPQEHIMHPQDWSFFALYTTADFLLNLDFMQKLEAPDKLILLSTFTGKASLFAGAMRTYREKRDKLVTVDGRDIYPSTIKQIVDLGENTEEFLNRIRSLLVSRLIELKITHEEFVLVTVLLFANPALPHLTDQAKNELNRQQKQCGSTLLQYCLLQYQQAGPSRFADLLSLYHVITKNFNDVQYLSMVFELTFKEVKFKKIVQQVIHNRLAQG